MKTKMKNTLTLLALGATAMFADAQDNNNDAPPGGPGGLRGGFRPPPLPIVTALDANHDGVIDADEIANASTALKTLDKNGDGKLTTDEYLPARPADAPKDAPKDDHRRPLPPIIKALDANGDGVIDADEISNAPAALKTLDKNSDGKLTRDEYLPPHPQRPPQGDSGNGSENGGDGNNPPPGPPPGDN